MLVGLLSLMLKFALGIIQYLERRRDLEQAKVEAVYELIKKADALVNDVDSIVRNVSNNPDDIMRDSANRDKR